MLILKAIRLMQASPMAHPVCSHASQSVASSMIHQTSPSLINNYGSLSRTNNITATQQSYLNSNTTNMSMFSLVCSDYITGGKPPVSSSSSSSSSNSYSIISTINNTTPSNGIGDEMQNFHHRHHYQPESWSTYTDYSNNYKMKV
jgi:hypothetical protein